MGLMLNGKARFILMCLLVCSVPAAGQLTAPKKPGDLSTAGMQVYGGLTMGYDIGMPVSGYLVLENVSEDLPLAFRFSLTQSFLLDAGDPQLARQVFVNQNSNGVPGKSASRWSYGADVLDPVRLFSMHRSFVYAGIRYSMFTANFQFIGGDEIFDVHSNQIGLAAGAGSYFRVSPRVDLLFSAGAEYYFPGTLEGHDAAYSSDGTMVNQRENFTYSDADRAINQPKFMPKIVFGVSYHFE
ncbi:MAG TPA: hypothetical protein VMW43_01420 [Bacteroidota bacterium]|nr:hypothetical protein [Bacteroidota bacterium]